MANEYRTTQGNEAVLAVTAGWKQDDNGRWWRSGYTGLCDTPRQALAVDKRMRYPEPKPEGADSMLASLSAVYAEWLKLNPQVNQGQDALENLHDLYAQDAPPRGLTRWLAAFTDLWERTERLV